MLLQSINNPDVLNAVILLAPMIVLGALLFVRPAKYFERVGMMLGFLLCVPMILLMNVLAEYLGWWKYAATANSYYNIPIEVILGWACFWGALLPYLFKQNKVLVAFFVALMIDLIYMPYMTGLFVLGEYWLIGEIAVLVTCLLPSLIIYQLTATRKKVLLRGGIQSYIWGTWIVFLIPSLILTYEHKSIFDIFSMNALRVLIFLIGMGSSMLIGYLAVVQLAKVGLGTPIPFDSAQKLVRTGIYQHVANPLQISTALMFICMALLYKSWMMLCPLIALILYTEIFVRWHHSVDIEQRFGEAWFEYRKQVRNWLPKW